MHKDTKMSKRRTRAYCAWRQFFYVASKTPFLAAKKAFDLWHVLKKVAYQQTF